MKITDSLLTVILILIGCAATVWTLNDLDKSSYKRGVEDYHNAKVFFMDGKVYPIDSLTSFAKYAFGDTVVERWGGDTLVIDAVFIPRNETRPGYNCQGQPREQVFYDGAFVEKLNNSIQ